MNKIYLCCFTIILFSVVLVMLFPSADAASSRSIFTMLVDSIQTLVLAQDVTNAQLSLIIELMKADESIYLEDVTVRYDFIRNIDDNGYSCTFFDRKENIIIDTSCSLDVYGKQ